MAYMLSTWEKDAAGVLLICTLPCTYMHRNMYPYRHRGANPMWVCTSISWGACASAWVIVFFFPKFACTEVGDMVLPGPCVSVLVRVPVHACAWSHACVEHACCILLLCVVCTHVCSWVCVCFLVHVCCCRALVRVAAGSSMILHVCMGLESHVCA